MAGLIHFLRIRKSEKYTAIWEQISDSFKDYNDYLMFESQNEELGWQSYGIRVSNADKEQSYQLVNEINQKFVDIVRSSEETKKRHLLINGYNTSIDETCDSLLK